MKVATIMYNEYFGFTDKPFHITPDLGFLFLSPKHKEAFSCMEYGIMGDMGVALITGDIGTGKTTLVRLFLKELPNEAKTACLFNTNVTPEQLLGLVIQEFGFSGPVQTKAQMIKVIQEGLQALHAVNQRPVLVIDDAQNLSLDALEEVRWLSNLQNEDRMLVQILLVGQPELRSKLKMPAMASLAQRIGVNYHLRPFTREEAGEYIAHRLKTVKGDASLFSDAALDLIFNSARGIPRTINLLCDNALVYAFADEKQSVDAGIVAQVLEEMFPEGLWDLPSSSCDIITPEVRKPVDTPAPPVERYGGKQPNSFQQMESLLEALGTLTDNYAKDLRNILKLMLKKENQHYDQLAAEYSRFKTMFKALKKSTDQRRKAQADNIHKNTTVPPAGKGRETSLKIADPPK